MFNIALAGNGDNKNVQNNRCVLEIGASMLDVLGFADDLNLLGNNKETVIQNTSTIIYKAKIIYLIANEEKPKVMKLLENYVKIF